MLEAVVKALLVLVTGNMFASPSLALLLKEFDPQNPLHSLLAQGNVMTFWFLAVVAIGLARLCTVSFGRAIVWVVGIWAACTGLKIGFAFAVAEWTRSSHRRQDGVVEFAGGLWAVWQRQPSPQHL